MYKKQLKIKYMYIPEKLQAILDECNNTFRFKPTNINRVFYNKLNDSYSIYNNVNRENTSRTVDALIDDDINAVIDKILHNNRSEVSKIQTHNYKGHIPWQYMTTPLKRFTLRNRINHISSKYGIGNCEERATYCFLQWIKHHGADDKCSMVIFSMKDPATRIDDKHKTIDHILLRVNHEDNVYFVDPWINKVYSQKDFNSVWRNNSFGIIPQDIKIKEKFSAKKFMSIGLGFTQEYLDDQEVENINISTTPEQYLEKSNKQPELTLNI